ncbi:unnamed protein product [Brassicogethes aeneus]|uniref:G-patch domain-containing protein n=1 Tax=Brassicogethes aeneus TaxID=1431903 RepID=A0A9P0FIQ1_BRAAE|nr:unnamed protein product [Brassicogethes aeneus]
MEEPKKISFGFSKLTKKLSVFSKPPVLNKKVELIDCLEGQSIKIKDAVEEVYQPLVIPIKDNKKNLLDRIKDAREKQNELTRKDKNKEVIDNRPDSELTIEELAARELIKEAKNRLEQSVHTTTKILVLPAVEEKPSFDGEKEATLEDYENIPINDFGLAMLRGMGWSESSGIGKNPTKNALLSAPELRPKGLGLGASKQVLSEKPKGAVDKEGKELIIKKGAYAKIIAGANKGNYCEVQGLHDEAGRVIVKTSLKKEILNVNEFLIVAVTSEEYAKGSKVINNAKYEEYKEKMEEQKNKKDEYSEKKVKEHKNSKTMVKKENQQDKVYEISSDEDEDYSSKSKASSSKRQGSSTRKDKYSKSSSHRRSRSLSMEKSKSSKKTEDRGRRREQRSVSEDERKEKGRSRRSRSRSRDRKQKKSKHKKKSHRSSSSSDSEDYDKKKKKKSKHKSKSKYRDESSGSDRSHHRKDRKGKR